MTHSSKKGFTLIELLVVISVISLLSSVVLGSVQSAREGARDKMILVEAEEFARLVDLRYFETNTFSGLHKSWNNCSFSTGPLEPELQATCERLTELSNGGNRTYIGRSNNFDESKYWSIMIKLSNGQYYCRGTSGKSVINNGGWSPVNQGTIGCYGNP